MAPQQQQAVSAGSSLRLRYLFFTKSTSVVQLLKSKDRPLDSAAEQLERCGLDWKHRKEQLFKSMHRAHKVHHTNNTRGAKKSTAELLEPALLEHFSFDKSILRSREHRCPRVCAAFSMAEACRPFGLSIASRAKSTAASLDENGKLESKGLKAFR